MKKLKLVIDNLKPVQRNLRWWRSGLGTAQKMTYYPRVVVSYARMATGKGKLINYLGHPMTFDHQAMPLILQEYPYEIGRQVLGNIDPDFAVDHVLDIGGNIGQFSRTFKHFAPRASVDVFEPNPAVLPMLEKNVGSLAGVRIFPYALSPETVESMYYEPGRSAIGSLIQENAGGLLNDLVEVPIKTSNDVVGLTGRDTYDLVKVDVEGFEMGVLSCLKGIRTRYLHIEISTAGRSKDYWHSELLDRVRDVFGPFDIIGMDEFNSKGECFYLMIEFRPNSRTGAATPAVDRSLDAAS